MSRWVVFRKASGRLVPWDSFLVLSEGPFAYPAWGTMAATLLGRAEAHQYAICFGTGDALAIPEHDPRVRGAGIKLLEKWAPARRPAS